MDKRESVEHHPLLELLRDYKPFDELEALHVQQLRQFLATGENHYDRSNLLGHIVADAWIVNPARDKIVQVHHLLNRIWMAPGGHCDGNPDVFAAAVRETQEETGLVDLPALLDGGIFDINVGIVPTRERHGKIEPAHMHFDVCFAFEASDNAPLQISDESADLAWIPVKVPKEFDIAPSHYRRYAKTAQGL